MLKERHDSTGQMYPGLCGTAVLLPSSHLIADQHTEACGRAANAKAPTPAYFGLGTMRALTCSKPIDVVKLITPVQGNGRVIGLHGVQCQLFDARGATDVLAGSQQVLGYALPTTAPLRTLEH